MRHLIVGYGEVGQAMHKIFPDAEILDPHIGATKMKLSGQYFDVMHICFPFDLGLFETTGGFVAKALVDDIAPGSVVAVPPMEIEPKFIKVVEEYKKYFGPNITIVHSSVPIGTCERLDVVHSPVRGVHPNIEKGLRTFVKYFGGFKAHEAAQLFEEQGIKTRVIRDSRTTEAAKLWDTTQYGIMILLEKEIYDFCRKNGLDFEVVYAEFNQTYHEGYKKLGMAYVTRPALMHKEGKIGGHCVVENAALLNTPLAQLIIERNKLL